MNKKCELCSGSGYRLGRACPICSSTGKSREIKKLKIKIPAGVEDGQKLKLSNIPIDSHHAGAVSDLLVIVRIKPHKFFTRRGNDIYCEVPLKSELLEKGTRIRISTVFGKKIDLHIKPGTQRGTTIRLAQMGLALNGTRGDQLIKVV